MLTIAEREKEIIAEFELFGEDWEMKYQHLIDLGKSLPIIASELKTADRLIKGCQSKLWLHAEMKNDRILYTADADAIITKGMAALMLRVLNDSTVEEIIHAKLDFINTIGLKEHLSPTRANGLVSLINQMKMLAISLSTHTIL